MVFEKFRIDMKSLKNYIIEAFKINKNTKLEKPVKFNIGDRVYILKRRVLYSVTYYEILADVIKDIKVVNIVHIDNTKTPQEQYKFTLIRNWTSVVFKTYEEAKQYCKDKHIKIM